MNKKTKIGIGILSLGVLSICGSLCLDNTPVVEKKVAEQPVVKTEKSFETSDLIDLAEKEIDGQYIPNINKKDVALIYGKLTMTEMPHIFVENIPEDFVVSTDEDKTLFMRMMTPHLLRANEKVLRERKSLLILLEKMEQGIALTKKEQEFIKKMSEKYDVYHLNDILDQMRELVDRVDIVPISLSMAVTIWSTDWGQKNKKSPFLEYAWNENLKYQPIEFNTLQEATDSFIHQINSRSQMADLRRSRRHLRRFTENDTFGMDLIRAMSYYLHFIPTFEDQLIKVYQLGFIRELDDACFKGKCELTK